MLDLFRVGVETHLLGRALRRAASPVPPWPGDRASRAQELASHPPGPLVPMDPRSGGAAGPALASADPTHAAALANGGGGVGPPPREPRPCGPGIWCYFSLCWWLWGRPLVTRVAEGRTGCLSGRLLEPRRPRQTSRGNRVSRSVKAAEVTPGNFSGADAVLRPAVATPGVKRFPALDSENPAGFGSLHFLAALCRSC